ncbi:hypothetical protein [Streptomyces daliensis]
MREVGDSDGTGRTEERAADHRSAVRRLVWGTAVGVAATAAMIAVTLPLNAVGNDSTELASRPGASSGTGAGTGTGTGTGTGSGAPAKIEAAPEQGERG